MKKYRTKTYKRRLLGLLIFFSVFVDPQNLLADEFRLELVKNSLAYDQIKPVTEFLKYVETLLPPTMKEKIGQKVFVDFSIQSDQKNLKHPTCPGLPRGGVFKPHEPQEPDPLASEIIDYGLPTAQRVTPITYGQTIGRNRIVLNRSLVNEVVRGPEQSKTYPCGHKTLYRLIVATVLHELAHLYDFSPRWFSSRLVSAEVRYPRLAGWSRHGLWNQMVPNYPIKVRSPDAYEYQSILENFAVNLEFFLLDPEYECRRPALHQYFVDHFQGFRPFPKCQVNPLIYPHSTTGGFNDDRLIALDPERVYEVDYLHLGSGKTPGSTQGRSMLKLVVCAPGRSRVGPPCLDDVEHHVVVSFLPLTTRVQMPYSSTWRRGFLTQEFVYLWADASSYLSRLELGGLEIYPIQLTPDQRRSLVYRVLENYWSYGAQLKPRGEAASVELGHLLKGILEQQAMKGFVARTPLSLKNRLARLGVINIDLMKDLRLAQENGNYIPSVEQSFQSGFEQIKSSLGQRIAPELFPWSDWVDYVSRSTPQERLKLFSAVDALRAMRDKPRVIHHLELMEAYIEFKVNHDLQSRQQARLEFLSSEVERKNGSQLSVADFRMGKLAQAYLKNNHPLTLIGPGYGIPLNQEFNVSLMDQLQSRQNTNELKKWTDETCKADFEKLKAIESNQVDLVRKMATSTFEFN